MWLDIALLQFGMQKMYQLKSQRALTMGWVPRTHWSPSQRRWRRSQELTLIWSAARGTPYRRKKQRDKWQIPLAGNQTLDFFVGAKNGEASIVNNHSFLCESTWNSGFLVHSSQYFIMLSCLSKYFHCLLISIHLAAHADSGILILILMP